MEVWAIVLISLGGVLLLVLILALIVGSYFCSFTFKGRPFKPFVADPKDPNPITLINVDPWLAEQKFERVGVRGARGTSLSGEYLPSLEKSHRFIIFLHGYRSRPLADWAALYKKFHERGFNCLGIDERAHGHSQGGYFSMGDLESDDLHFWVDYLVNKDPEAEIVLMGRSMGAHITMLSFRKPYPPNVKCFIEDAGYYRLKDELIFEARSLHIAMAPLIVTLGMWHLDAFHHARCHTCVEEALKGCEVPGLFIHGEADKMVPFADLDKCYSSLKCPDKEKAGFPGAAHVSSEAKDEKRFDEILFSFVGRHIA